MATCSATHRFGLDSVYNRADVDASKVIWARLPVDLNVIMKIPNGFLEVILVTASVAMPGYFAARHVAAWPARVNYPGELDNAESSVLAEMIHLREGVPVYAPASPQRFDSVLYGPLFYLLCSRLIDPQKPSHTLPRELSLFATLGMAAGCALLAFWLARRYLAAAIAALLFLSYPFVTHFGTQNRCDGLALLLWFSGFLVAYRFRDSRKLLFAVPLMTLGFYYKQQFIAAPLAILLFLILEKRFRLAAEFVALLGIAGLSLLASFQFLVFRHQSFLLHFFGYNVIPVSWRQCLGWTLVLGVTFLVPCAAAVQFLRTHPNRLLACYFCWVVPLLFVTMARRGANINYAIELLLVLCPLLAAQLAISFPRPSRAALGLCLLAATLWLGNIFPVWVPQAKDIAQDKAVQVYLRENFPPKAPALGLYVGDLVRAGLDTPMTDLANYTWLVCEGKLSDQILLTPFRERRYAILVLRFDLQAEKDRAEPGGGCLPHQFYQAIVQNYRPVDPSAARLFEAKRYYAWIPRQ